MELSGLSDAEKKQRIDAFVEQLSPWDLIRLRQQMRQRTVRLKSLQDLPSELICLIVVDHLNAKHALRLTRVSRCWRAAVQQPDVARSLCRTHFPGLLETTKHQVGEEFSIFQKAYMHLRRKYQRRTPNLYTLQRWFVQGERSAFDARQVNTVYSQGKMAWQPDDSFFYFQNLKNGHDCRQVYFAGAVVGWKLDLLTMSDQLIVMTLVDAAKPNFPCRKLKVWHIESMEFRSITLTAPLAKCYPSGLKLYMTTLTEQVFAWEWDKPLKEIVAIKEGLSAPPENHLPCLRGIPAVMPHPLDSNTVHLAWLYVSDAPITKPGGLQNDPSGDQHDDRFRFWGESSDSYYPSYTSYTDTDESSCEHEARSFHSSAIGSNISSDIQSSSSEQGEPDVGPSVPFTGRTRRESRALKKTPVPKRFTIVVVKYTEGTAVCRMEYGMAEARGASTPLTSAATRYYGLDLYFQMLCQPLDQYGTFLVGITWTSVYNSRRLNHQGAWGGISFNVFSGKFDALEYVQASGRTTYTSGSRTTSRMGASFAAHDLSLVVTGGPRHLERHRSSSATIVLYAENTAQKLGLLDYKRSSAWDADREPGVLIDTVQDITFDRDGLKLFMDSVGTLMPASDYLLFSYSGKDNDESKGDVVTKVGKATVPHEWMTAERRRMKKQKHAARSRLHSPTWSSTASSSPVNEWEIGEERRRSRRMRRRRAVEEAGDSEDAKDDAQDEMEAVEMVTDCWNVPYGQLRREFCTRRRQGDDYSDICTAFRWGGAQVIDAPVPPELEVAEVEIRTCAPRRGKGEDKRWPLWKEGISRSV